jgi:hypothetical protein
MKVSIFKHFITPFLITTLILGVATMAGDALLHYFGWVGLGRYLGILGTILIIMSLSYSLRKRKYIQAGSPQAWLRFHEYTAWLGSVMVLVHSGVHFNSILPWLATAAMAVNVLSGMVGKFLLGRSRQAFNQQRTQLQQEGFNAQETQQELFWNATALDLMSKWRKVHIPIFIAFVVLALGHIVSIFLFWGWI